MSDKKLIVIHGWSDNSTSFQPLSKWLREQGLNVVDIYLADYLSMNDEVTLPDLGLAMQRAIAAKEIPQTRHSFDVLTHSTGGLVAREYLRQICQGNPQNTPIKRLCMLAPANFGSPLAALGKSLIGRLFKGWSWDHMFQSGKKVLEALELGSPYSYALALDDLFQPGYDIFSPANTMATVMAGTIPYPDMLRSTVHENGSDGTVRVSTANINAHYLKVDFKDPDHLTWQSIPPANPEIAMAVLHRNHSSITQPDSTLSDYPVWQEILLCSLTLEEVDYPAHLQRCVEVTSETYSEGLKSPKDRQEWYHQYQHVVFRVHDQFGEPINDYFVEFYQENDDPQDTVFKTIHAHILEKVVTSSVAPNYRSFLFDTSDLTTYLDSNPQSQIQMSIAAANISNLIHYLNPGRSAGSGIPVFTPQQRTFIYPNQPVLVDITLYRDPQSKVFQLTAYS